MAIPSESPAAVGARPLGQVEGAPDDTEIGVRGFRHGAAPQKHGPHTGTAPRQHVELEVAHKQYLRRLNPHLTTRPPHWLRCRLGWGIVAGYNRIEFQAESAKDQLHTLSAVSSHQAAPQTASLHPVQEREDAVHRLCREGGGRLVPFQDRLGATPLRR